MKKLIGTLFLLAISYLSFSQLILYNDTLNFEESRGYLFLDTDSNSIWEIGTPNKVFFDSAHSAPFAIVTDTIDYYPINNYSVFMIKFEPSVLSTHPVDTYLKFWHKFDTDTLNDYGKVEISYDGGNAWILPSSDSIFFVNHQRRIPATTTIYCCPDDLFSGRSNDWYIEEYIWTWYLPVKTGFSGLYPDSIWIKFSFVSDSIQTNKEGWLIDDITITSDFYSGINETSNNFISNAYPNPVNSSLIIETNSQERELNLRIYDCFGKEIAFYQFTTTNFIIDTKEFSSGFYFYQLIDSKEKKISVGKFIVEK